MKVIQTPDVCFEDLHAYPFAPNFAEVPDLDGGTLRVHYVDEGPKDAAPIGGQEEKAAFPGTTAKRSSPNKPSMVRPDSTGRPASSTSDRVSAGSLLPQRPSQPAAGECL